MSKTVRVSGIDDEPTAGAASFRKNRVVRLGVSSDLYRTIQDMHDYYRIAEAIQYIREHQQEQPELEEIAQAVHLSPFHFQRMFSEWAGVSPKKFLQYLTINHAKRLLQQPSATLFDVALDSGLSGTSRLHDLFVNIEGMTPGEYKQGGKALTIYYSVHESPFGWLVAASTDKGICNVFFLEDPAEAAMYLREEWPQATLVETRKADHLQVLQFFQRDLQKEKPLHLHLKGTPFQLKVWEALLKIPEGRVGSYQQVAQSIQQPKASRAVGSAIGSNPVAFVIPCHRVIRTVGGIGEYRWGSTRKMALIGWELSRQQPQIA